MANGQRTVSVRIDGRVQGVGFRAWTQSQSRMFGLAGWVRNEPDGSVTALIQGEESAVASMLERLRGGPPGAGVRRLDAEDCAAAALPRGFEIRY